MEISDFLIFTKSNLIALTQKDRYQKYYVSTEHIAGTARAQIPASLRCYSTCDTLLAWPDAACAHHTIIHSIGEVLGDILGCIVEIVLIERPVANFEIFRLYILICICFFSL